MSRVIWIELEDHFDNKVEYSGHCLTITNDYKVILPDSVDTWAVLDINELPDIITKVIEFVLESERAKTIQNPESI